jgi:hypothetical protein
MPTTPSGFRFPPLLEPVIEWHIPVSKYQSVPKNGIVNLGRPTLRERLYVCHFQKQMDLDEVDWLS